MKNRVTENIKLGALYSLAIGPIMIGGNLFLYFMDKIPLSESDPAGVFDYIWLNTGVLGTFILTTISMKKRQKKRGKIPPADERTVQILKKYFLSALSIIFFLSVIILLALFLSGVETIEIGWIFVYLSVLIIFTLIGTFVVSRV